MSNPPHTSTPRFLLFPQVDRSETPGKRPVVRRYSLALLQGGSNVDPRPARLRPTPRGLTTA